MAKVKVDWTVIRGSVITLVVCLAISAALLSSAFYYKAQIDRSHRIAQLALNSARGDFLALDEEKQLVEIFYPRFQALEAQGIVGQEQRLNWTETLQNAARRLKLPALRYGIEPRRDAQPTFPIKTGAFDLFASDMRIDAGLLHEADLPDLLYEIETYGAGLFSVSGCRLTSNGKVQIDDSTKANIEAECLLRWYTVRLPGEGRP